MSRKPEKLILAFLGEFALSRPSSPVPAAAILNALALFELPDATTRATLRRMEQRQLLESVRSGRSVSYLLTDRSRAVLVEADARVRSTTPFAPSGPGWTLVSFSVPERQRDARNQLRSSLIWAGFGLLRDGLWIAPGRVEVRRMLAPSLPSLTDVALTIFFVEGFDEFGHGDAVVSAWDLAGVSRLHREFTERWSQPLTGDSMRDIIALLADWLDVLRADPRLPADVLPLDWPSRTSARAFHKAYAALHDDAQQQFLEQRKLVN